MVLAMESGRGTVVPWRAAAASILVVVAAVVIVAGGAKAGPQRRQRVLVDTDMDTDDLFALLYILKQNRSEFELKCCVALCIWVGR
ncbi:hypothetical protein EJB05_35485, partial [Eragrostis curvula]